MSGAADWKRSAILIDWEPDVHPVCRSFTNCRPDSNSVNLDPELAPKRRGGQIESQSGGNVGIGFAVPSNTVTTMLGQVAG
jgi:hypothetical protein